MMIGTLDFYPINEGGKLNRARRSGLFLNRDFFFAVAVFVFIVFYDLYNLLIVAAHSTNNRRGTKILNNSK